MKSGIKLCFLLDSRVKYLSLTIVLQQKRQQAIVAEIMAGAVIFSIGGATPRIITEGGGTNKMLNDQHGVNWVPENYPGSGHLLIFNNNPLDSTGQDNSLGNSSVVEIITPLNNNSTYDISMDSSYGPSNYHWVFGGDDSFFSHFQFFSIIPFYHSII